ncbi:reverse transcriptase domain-containing protein, partial [Tanacetum coccineum]
DELKNIRRDILSAHQATQQFVHDFSMTFLDRARFLPEYINDQKFLMNHYVDMLRKEIREFISAKDWKNMDELMNAALKREQKTKKRERSPLKRRIEHGGSSSKKFKSNETYPRFGGKGYPQCTNCVKFHLGKCCAGSKTCFSYGKHGHIRRECPKPAHICKKCYQPNHTTESCPNTRPPPPQQQEPKRNTNRRGAPPAPNPPGAPSLAGFQRPQRPLSRVFQMMTTKEAKEALGVVTCTFFVNLLPARVLFDSGVNRSFVSDLVKISSCQSASLNPH